MRQRFIWVMIIAIIERAAANTTGKKGERSISVLFLVRLRVIVSCSTIL